MRKAIILLLICAVAAAASDVQKGMLRNGGDQTEEYRFAGYYNWFLGQEEYKGLSEFFQIMMTTFIGSDQFASQVYRDGEYLILERQGQAKGRSGRAKPQTSGPGNEEICMRMMRQTLNMPRTGRQSHSI